MELIISVEQNEELPLYRAISEAIKDQIASGKLKPGQQIPSIRELASSFGTSRSTILRTYELLSSQGFIETTPKSGTKVSQILPGSLTDIARNSHVMAQKISVDWTDFAERLDQQADRSTDRLRELNYGAPSPHFFPIHQWKKCLLSSPFLDTDESPASDPQPFGYIPLRESLVHYLSRSRANRCTAKNIMLQPNWGQALDLFCRLILRPADSVALEVTSSPAARRVFRAHDLKVNHVSADIEGISIQELRELPVTPKLLFISPSHQPPTGTTTSLKRRLALLEWAREVGCFIWEDDNDNEYRYGKRPLPSMQGLDQSGCVIYSSSLWRTLGPLVSMDYVVLPDHLIGKFEQARAVVAGDLPILEQSALAQFIDSGCLERHIYKSRSVFEKLRQTLIFQLKVQLRNKVDIAKAGSGTTVLVTLSEDIDELDIDVAAEHSGLCIAKTHCYYSSDRIHGEYLISFIAAPEDVFVQQVQEFCQIIADSICSTSDDSANDLDFEATSDPSNTIPTAPINFETAQFSLD